MYNACFEYIVSKVDMDLTIEFSNLYKQSLNLCLFSPCSRYIATAVQSRLVIRDTESLKIVAMFQCQSDIHDVQWSQDSEYILAVTYKKVSVEIWSLKDPEWNGMIEEGVGGLRKAMWGADARSVICFSDFSLRVTIWNLTTGQTFYIKYPKWSDKGIEFRKDGKYAILAERREGKDSIGVYDCKRDWSLVKHFTVETIDMELIAFSPDGMYIAISEISLDYKVLIYTADGRLLKIYSAYKEGLGVKTLAWAPSGQFLAIGSYDQKVRILNNIAWNPIVELAHVEKVNLPNVRIQLESENMNLQNRSRLEYKDAEQPLNLPSTRPDPERPNPKIGIGFCEFSADGRYLATRNDNFPTTLWLWDMKTFHVKTLLIHQQPIRHVKWNPINPKSLALCTGNGCLYLWNDGIGCEPVEIPTTNFKISSFSWSSSGKVSVLMDKELFCVAYFEEENKSEPVE